MSFLPFPFPLSLTVVVFAFVFVAIIITALHDLVAVVVQHRHLRRHHVVDGGGARGHVRPLQRVVDVATEHGQVLREPEVEEFEDISF